MADASLSDLLHDLAGYEALRQQTAEAYEQSRSMGPLLKGSLAVHHYLLSLDYGRVANEHLRRAIAHEGADRLKTVCIAKTGNFTAKDLRQLCADAAIRRDWTLDRILSLTPLAVAEILQRDLKGLPVDSGKDANDAKPTTDEVLRELFNAAIHQANLLGNSRFRVYREMFPWYNSAMVDAGWNSPTLDEATVRDIDRRAGEEWQRTTRLRPLDDETAWRAAAAAAGYKPTQVDDLDFDRIVVAVIALGLARLSEVPKAVAQTAGQGESEGKAGTSGSEFRFVQDGDGYFIAGFGESGHIKRSKGFDVLFRLIQSPGVPVLAMELVDKHGQPGKSDTRSRQESLDKKALGQIWASMSELKQDADRANAVGDTVEADVTNRQIAKLQQQLDAALGAGGRPRDINSEWDKVRPRIFSRLTTAYKTFRSHDVAMLELAAHFEAAVSSESGAFVYRPAADIEWETSSVRKE